MTSSGPSADILGIPSETFRKLTVLTGILLLGSLWQNLPSPPTPTEIAKTPPFPPAVAAGYVGEPILPPTVTATPTPTPVLEPTVESFKRTNYVEAMRFMDKTFGQIAPYYKGGSVEELSGIGIALMLTETDADTTNWLQIEKATQKEALEHLRKRVGNENYKKIVAGKNQEDLSIIAACAKVGEDYEYLATITERGESKEMRRSLMYFAYNGGLPFTVNLWWQFHESKDWKKDATWVDFSKYVEENSGWLSAKVKKDYRVPIEYLPAWMTDVKVYLNRAEALYGYAVDVHRGFLKGKLPSEEEVQKERRTVFAANPARVR